MDKASTTRRRFLRPSRIPSILLCTVALISITIVHHRHRTIPLLSSHPITITNTKCIVYDRPMRTGSTTVSDALSLCISGMPTWTIPPRPSAATRHTAIQTALKPTPRKHIAIIRGHIWLANKDVALLRTHCKHLIYITACAPLHQQLWSAAKMLSNIRRNGNTTLGATGAANALQWLRVNADAYRRLYEYYPFIRVTAPLVPEKGSRRFPDLPPSFEKVTVNPAFVPDYVIRKQFLRQDMELLLSALGCEEVTMGEAKNVHVVEGEGEEWEEEIRKIVGDSEGETYTRLTKVAGRNAEGLRRIRTIMGT